MKSWLCACLIIFAMMGGAKAQNDVSGATIPVMRTPDGTGTTPSVPPANSGVTITRPVPESTIQPHPVVHTPTPAESAADQAIRKQADSDVSDYAERVADRCDADFKARIDWTTVSALQTHRYNPADACGAALQAIDEICATDAARQRVAAEIKSVICTTGPQPSIEMHAGTLVYTIDWQSPNPGARVYSWLASHL